MDISSSRRGGEKIFQDQKHISLHLLHSSSDSQSHAAQMNRSLTIPCATFSTSSNAAAPPAHSLPLTKRKKVAKVWERTNECKRHFRIQFFPWFILEICTATTIDSFPRHMPKNLHWDRESCVDSWQQESCPIPCLRTHIAAHIECGPRPWYPDWCPSTLTLGLPSVDRSVCVCAAFPPRFHCCGRVGKYFLC